MKPRIRKDLFKTEGFTCRSREGVSWHGGSRFVVGTGDTEAEAYANWQRRLELSIALQGPMEKDFETLKVFQESVYRSFLGPVARFFRSITHRREGTKR